MERQRSLPRWDGPEQLGAGRERRAGQEASCSSHTKKKQIGPMILSHCGCFKQKGTSMVSIMVLGRTSGVTEV